MRYKVKKDGKRYAVYDSVTNSKVKWFDFKDHAIMWRNDLEKMIEKEKRYNEIRDFVEGLGISSYRQFVSSEMKKRPKGVSATEFMKEIGKRWRSQKQGGSLFPVLDYTNWENAFYDQNEDQIVYYIKKYGDEIPIDELPTGVGQAVQVLIKYPRETIQAKKALNTLFNYSPAGLFNSLFG